MNKVLAVFGVLVVVVSVSRSGEPLYFVATPLLVGPAVSIILCVQLAFMEGSARFRVGWREVATTLLGVLLLISAQYPLSSMRVQFVVQAYLLAVFFVAVTLLLEDHVVDQKSALVLVTVPRIALLVYGIYAADVMALT